MNPSSPCRWTSLAQSSETSATRSPLSRSTTAALSHSPSPRRAEPATLSSEELPRLLEGARLVVEPSRDPVVRVDRVERLEIARLERSKQ